MQQCTLHHNKKSIFDATVQAANSLDLVVNRNSFADGHIELEHPGSLLSYGNIIEIKIKSADNNKHIVFVSSRSMAQIQLIDWGTNDRLESSITETIKEILSQ
jgi:ribosomal protein S1